MDKIIINGGKPLSGRVKVSGAKNAALPAMAASLLGETECVVVGIPRVADINTMGKLLRELGSEVEMEGGSVRIRPVDAGRVTAPYRLVKTMRASVLVLGPLLARRGKARVSLPGGCAIGARPIDLHLRALEAMGAEIRIRHGYVEGRAGRLKGARITFDRTTVTGTENVMMAAVLADGSTVIENAALEPEVTDLADMLTGMGAKIEGAGSERISIEGVPGLRGTEHRVVPDRIEAGTLLIAGAITGGDVTAEGAAAGHLSALADTLTRAGLKVEPNADGVRVISSGRVWSVDVSTQPFPGFPTDLQAQVMALMAVARGTSVITENIFENRFMHVSELDRMGADIRVEGKTAVVRGVERLSGAPVMASDLRASAGLILAGLAAEGETEVTRIYHLDRGYERLDEKLKLLGAEVRREKE